MIDQRRRLRSLGAALDIVPQAFQEANVGAQFVFTRILCRRANDKASMAVVALAHHDALQPLPLFVGCDLARHSGVVHRRHVDQEPSRQRDVAGDARAFLADGLLRNLHQNFLAFLQQIADLRDFLRLAARKAATTSTASATLPVETRPRTRRSLRITGCPRRSANLRSGIDGTGSAGFCVEQRFRFGLRLFQFQFLGVFLADGAVGRRRNPGLG